MAKIMTRSRPVIEGNTGMKFSEIVVIVMAVAGIVYGVRWYLDYRRSASFALTEYVGAVKAGNGASQYALIDDSDKKTLFPSLASYEKTCTLAHGYTERIENSTLAPEEKNPKSSEKVTIPLTVVIRGSAEGKQLYQTGQAETYSDRIVMHKGADGKWRVVLSQSADPETNMLHLQKSPPSVSNNY